MSRLDDIIPENEDKLAWLLGVTPGEYFKFRGEIYKADEIILQAVWTADVRLVLEEIEQREAYNIILHSEEIQTPPMWNGNDAKIAKYLGELFSNYHYISRINGVIKIYEPCGTLVAEIWAPDLLPKLPEGTANRICLNAIRECKEVPQGGVP